MSFFYLSLCTLAYVVGLPTGYAFGILKWRWVRMPILPILMIAPALFVAVWMLNLANDDIGPLFWVPVALGYFAIPLSFWSLAVGCGYYAGSKRRLYRQTQNNGMIG